MSARDSLPKAAALEKIEAPSAEVAEAQRKAVQRDIADNEGFSQAVRDLDKLNEAAGDRRAGEPVQGQKRVTVKTEQSDAERLTSPSLRKLLGRSEKEAAPPSVRTTDDASKISSILLWLMVAGVGVVILLTIVVVKGMNAATDPTRNTASNKAIESSVATTTATASGTSHAVENVPPIASTSSAVTTATSVTSSAPAASSSTPVKSATTQRTSATVSAGPTAPPPLPPPPLTLNPPTTAPAATSGVKPWFTKK